MASKYPANTNGLPFGAYVLTALGYPARVAGRSDALRTFVEAWGDGHEVGDERTGTLMPISRDDFEFMCLSMGQDPDDVQTPRLRQWDEDNESPEREVTGPGDGLGRDCVPRHLECSGSDVCSNHGAKTEGGKQMGRFLESEKQSQTEFKRQSKTFSEEARKPGVFGKSARDFCVPQDLSAENLFPGIRAAALEYFGRYGIRWHQEVDGRPSNHLCDSQVCCVNFLAPLQDKPGLLGQLLSQVLPDLRRVLPIEPSGEHIAFEYIGSRNFLGERVRRGANRTRGANCTSADGAVLYECEDGRRALLLIEWKYTESVRTAPLRFSSRGTDRLGIYLPLLEQSDSPFDKTVLQDFADLLYDPFDQLMRQQLLAHELEKARELGAERVSVLHIAPACNHDFRRVVSPGLSAVGATVMDVWPRLLRNPDRFRSVSTELLFAPLLEGSDPSIADWQQYITQRYSWVSRPAADAAASGAQASRSLSGF